MSDEPQTVLITGAGNGLGEAMATAFADAGYAVAVTDVDAERAKAVADQLRAAGHQVMDLALNVTSDSDWDDACRQVMDAWGRLDVLINNAGVAAAGRLEDTPLDDWQWVLDIDLMGVVRGCHRFLPLMRQQGAGHIVNVASFAGLAGAPEICAYGTAKAGVVALSEQLRAELHGTDIGVSVLCPAFVATGLLETFRAPSEDYGRRVQRWMEHSPVSAEMVAQRVLEAVENQQFLILTHRETAWAWRLKRWMPERYFRALVKRGSVSRRGERDA